MKKILVLLLCLSMIICLSACSKKDDSVPEDNQDEQQEISDNDPSKKGEGILTYEEYLKTPSDGSIQVVIEGYVQGCQSYLNGAILYVQDPDGAYFVYCDGNGKDVNLSENDYAKIIKNTNYDEGWTGLADGVKVKVTGNKSENNDEVMITNSTVEVLDGEKWVAEPVEVTNLLGKDKLIDYQNQKVKFIGLRVEPSIDQDGNEVAFLYNYDGSGSKESNSDLYFNVSYNDSVYNFCVESNLTYEGSDVYSTVESLNIGDYIDVEAFLYWYKGANPHVYNISVNAK